MLRQGKSSHAMAANSQVACNKITGSLVIAPPRYRPGALNAQLLAQEDRLKDHHCPYKGPILTFSHDVCLCVCLVVSFTYVFMYLLHLLMFVCVCAYKGFFRHFGSELFESWNIQLD